MSKARTKKGKGTSMKRNGLSKKAAKRQRKQREREATSQQHLARVAEEAAPKADRVGNLPKNAMDVLDGFRVQHFGIGR